MRHAWFLVKGGGLRVYENCAAVYTPTLTYGVNDQIRIEVEGGYVRYKIQPGGGGGWQTLFTSTQPVTAPLYLDTAFLTLGSTLKQIRFVSGSTAAISVNRTYYMFGGARVAMRDGAGAALVYLHGDHLGSASLATSMTGTVLSQQRYKPYGEIRWTSGAGMPTDFTFTSQRAGPPSYVGSLTDYVARFYSPALGRFISADTLVPGAGSPQAFNRYSYVFGNPLGLHDPTGHWPGQREPCPDDVCNQTPHFAYLEGGIEDVSFTKTYEWLRAHPDYTPEKDEFIQDENSNVKERVDVQNVWLNSQKPNSLRLAGGKAAALLSAAVFGVAIVYGMNDAPIGPRAASPGAGESSTGKGRLRPNSSAEGPHTTFKRDPQTGQITHYETWQPQSNPRNKNPWESVKRYDGNGKGDGHYNKVLQVKVDTPHVHDPVTPGGVRPALPKAIPR